MISELRQTRMVEHTTFRGAGADLGQSKDSGIQSKFIRHLILARARLNVTLSSNCGSRPATRFSSRHEPRSPRQRWKCRRAQTRPNRHETEHKRPSVQNQLSLVQDQQRDDRGTRRSKVPVGRASRVGRDRLASRKRFRSAGMVKTVGLKRWEVEGGKAELSWKRRVGFHWNSSGIANC